MKTILIMRHGEAGPMQADDAARLLTERGQKQAFDMGEWLSRVHNPGAILVSPYVRAQQTADAVKQSNEFTYQETCSDIIPSGSASFAIDYLETLISMHEEVDTWLVIAHMPIVSYMVDQLVHGEMPIFPTAGVAVIEYCPKTHKSNYKGLQAPRM
ncbi:phosphohistidine phosphatase SixA [Pseudoalteromonas luteoviolacea]|uniref:phosphohistidine phosphatase SixA n=1 Tax=Pseudoalteromonas luteoviolacea TaxID=43657 RepID=UPI001EEE64E4|nr:phosphohistidine phosphatase SixA [Pseudoalteromonas luteoviolacea]MCF6440199.1 phosphohistidine phosphatase SixA [Pseudoalteromonas luteoviolacea]